MSGLLVITDLDGSLLDHYSYSFDAALPMLAHLRERRVPVVLCSSKTRAEMQALRSRLGLNSPYIVENGAAIYFPLADYPDLAEGAEVVDTEWRVTFGEDRAHWQSIIQSLPDYLREPFRRFSKMTIGQIADLTGLPHEDARRASLREFGEPLHWRGDDDLKPQLIEALESKGARVLQGGRFLHVAGHWDKGTALNWLAAYLTVNDRRPLTIALGDSQNDVAMLEAADYAIVIRSPVHDPPQLGRRTRTVMTSQTGPSGWTEGLADVLARLSDEQD